MAYNFQYLRLESGRKFLIGQMLQFIIFRRALYISTAEELCKKKPHQLISLGHLISKHEMFCFEKTAFLRLNILYFEKQYKLYGLNLVCTKVVNK
jgi:23S rRNA maturation-related 3'-5' exoribonuclease YhaM